MSRLTGKHLFVFFGLIVTVAAAVHFNRPRVLAQHRNPDGTLRVVVGKPRLCGLMGIEIVLQDRRADGTVTYAAVQDLFSSWEPAIRRYENQDGGGLLKPIGQAGNSEPDQQPDTTHGNDGPAADGSGN